MSADNAVRSAIGEALGYPFAEEAFTFVDLIEVNVRADAPAPESTRHEVAAEMTEAILDTLSTRQLAVLWAVSSADGEGFETFGGRAEDKTSDRIRLDMFVVAERAVFAALTAYAEESRPCKHVNPSNGAAAPREEI